MRKKKNFIKCFFFVFCIYYIWMYDKTTCKILRAYNFINARVIILVRKSCKEKMVMGQNFVFYCW